MINKHAISVAKQYIRDAYSDENIRDISLEEITRNSADSWNVTLSFRRDSDFVPALATFVGTKASTGRIYKIITISDDTGEVYEMRNRPND